MNMRLLLPLVAFFCHLSLQAEPRTEILQLHHRSAEELLPLIQSILGEDGRVSAHGSQLIVNAEPSKLAELQELLPQLDTRPRRLLITLDNSRDSTGHRQDQRLDGSITAGDAEIAVGTGEHQGRDQIRIFSRSTGTHNSSRQQVQTTEGHPAQIQVGQSVPLTSYSHDAYGSPYPSIEYRDLGQGFEVTANVHGDRVELHIRSQQDRLGKRPGTIDTQSTATHVSGRLGEWIDLGGISEGHSAHSSDVLARQHGNALRSQRLRLKVELLE